jgi:hypothetical protein
MCVSVCDDLCVGQGRVGGSVLGLAQYLPRIKELFEYEVTLLDPRSECSFDPVLFGYACIV